MRLIGTGLAALLLCGAPAVALAQSDMPKAAQPEKTAGAGAALGATLFEVGERKDGTLTYVAHGYAAPETRAPTADDISTKTGEIVFRLKELCLTAAQAQLSPIAIMPAPQPGTAGREPSFYITGVDVEITEQQKETCTYAVKITYGLDMPREAKLTQIGYTVFMTGSKRNADVTPQVLPRIPL